MKRHTTTRQGGRLAMALVRCAAVAAAVGWGAAASGQDLAARRGKGNVLGRHDGRVGGLGFWIRLDGWPELSKPAVSYYSTGEGGGFGKLPPALEFGSIMAVGSARQATMEQRDWTHAVFAPAESLKLYASRLTPALVVETPGRDVLFFGGKQASRPKYLAGEQGVVRPEADEPVVVGESPWLLAWFGGKAGFRSTRFPYVYDGRHWIPGPSAAVDCPVLFVFDAAGAEVRVSDEGLTVRHPAGSGPHRVAVLPLFGEAYPPAGDTEAWAGGLPPEVNARCQWWAEHLAEVPISAEETYSYDEPSDTVTLAARFTYLKLRDGGTRLAPLPPMLALAREHGLAMDLSAEPVRTGVLTSIGPYAALDAADRYECRLGGLGRYVLQARSVRPDADEPPELAARLRQEIEKVVQVGHLAPWYPAVNAYGAGYRTYLVLRGTLAWGNPGENLYLLAEALPLLDDEPRAALLDYMQAEWQAYPPDQIAMLQVEQGARRERWRIDEGEIQEILLEHNDLVKRHNFYVSRGLIPEETLYYLAELARLGGPDVAAADWPAIKKILEPYLRAQDWATLGWYRWPGGQALMDGLGGVTDANRHFAALVGALRLARAAGDRDNEPYLWGQFARAAILRYAMGRYGDYLYANRLIVLPTDKTLTQERYLALCGEVPGHDKVRRAWGRADWMPAFFSGSWVGRLYTYDWTSPADDVRSVVRLNEFGVYFDEVVTQYHGQGDLLAYRGIVPELARFLADHEKPRARAFVDRVDEHMPDWYLAQCQADLGAEHNYIHPDNSWQCFMTRAWVLGEPGDSLRRYLDVPWMARGDLYYIHKLSETIRAYRGTTWAAAK